MTLPPLRLTRMALSIGVLVAAALVALIAAWGAVGAIENLSQSSVKSALLLDGEDWVQVETDGLQVVLTGTAPDERARFKALSAAGRKVDNSRVIDHMEVLAAQAITPPTFSIEMLRNEAGISMIGLIPAATDRVALGETVQKIDLTRAVTDLLETADYPVPERWDAALAFSLHALELLPRSKISISADKVAVEAIADSAGQKASWERDLRGRAPGGVRISLDITAPRPVITPFTLRFTMDAEGSRFDACTAHTDAGRSKIVVAGAAAGVKGQPNCTIALGVPSPDWPDAVARGIAAVHDMGGGSLTFSDADVTLVAAEGTPQNTFDRVVGELEADLPDVFSLHAVLPVVDADVAAGPPEFVATLSPEGQVQLRGRVADEQERTVTDSYARARFGVDNVYAAMRLDPTLPRGWAVRTLAGLEALSQLASGIVTVQPSVVDISGKTGDKGASAEISRVLSEKLGEAEDFHVNVRYEEALDPVASAPSPTECAASINEVLSGSKITFAPGSANIEAVSAGTIDKIAEILKSCPDVAMEVGGYTDAQGGEEMNKALSQRRADAVLSALLARRVLTSNLTAHGYGEENPIADNDTEAGREANRRIEFRLIGDDATADGSGTATGDASAGGTVETEGTPTENAGTTPPPPRPGDAAAAEGAADHATDDAKTETPAAATADPAPETPAGAAAAPDVTTAETTATAGAAAAPDQTPEAAPSDTPDTAAQTPAPAAAGPADTTAAPESPAEANADATATTDETAAETAPDGAPAVVDPDLAGRRPKPRPAQ